MKCALLQSQFRSMLSLEERIFLVEHVFRNGGHYSEEVQQQFAEAFPHSAAPHRNAVYQLIHKFRTNGSVADAPRSGRPQTVTTAKVDEIMEHVQNTPNTSIRKCMQVTGLSYGAVQRTMRSTLHLKPYKISCVNELQEADYEKRVAYCIWFADFIRKEGDDILDITFFSDEAWFHLGGYVNSQNNRYWSTGNPHHMHESPLHQQKIGVWCAMSRKRIIGPIFFSETISSDRYCELIITPFLEQLQRIEKRHGYFQQDGATAHTANNSMSLLRGVFGDRMISRGTWPPRSPDLTPPDFYLWGHLKGRVYRNNPLTIEDLKTAILNDVREINNSNLLSRVFQNMMRRIELCLHVDGAHFHHLL